MGSPGFPMRTIAPLPQTPRRYAITPGAGAARDEFAALASQWAAAGVDLIQLREPALSAGALYHAARAILAAIASQHAPAKLLINSRADVAIAAGAHGVHLTSRSGELTAAQVRTLYAQAGLPRPIVSISTHTLEDVRRSYQQQVDLILFGPVFEKRVQGELVREGSGLDLLRQACAAAASTPVLALGGVTAENAPQCLAAGAAGIAAIRLFEQR
jgi:thiamine-phosphate pyrophosphorylase